MNPGLSSTQTIRPGRWERGEAERKERQAQDRVEVQEVDLNLSLVPSEAGWGLELNLDPPEEGPQEKSEMFVMENEVHPKDNMFQQARDWLGFQSAISVNWKEEDSVRLITRETGDPDKESETRFALLILEETPQEVTHRLEQKNTCQMTTLTPLGRSVNMQPQISTEQLPQPCKKRKIPGEKSKDKEGNRPIGKERTRDNTGQREVSTRATTEKG